jgi:hypothetical protein
MVTLKSVFENIVWLTLLCLFSAGVGSAEVRLPSIISDNMVIQQGMKVRIWGKANAGEHVTVTFGNPSTPSLTSKGVGRFGSGREIYQSLKVPIGLINTSWGGTPAEAWTSAEALKSSAELQPILDRYESSLKAQPETKEAYERALVQWEEKNLYIDSENKGEALGYADPATSTADWAKMDLPKQFEAAGLLIDGLGLTAGIGRG